jgi:hypothetical protein
MSNALSHQTIIVENKFQWQERYWKLCLEEKGIELPMPCMWRKAPCFSGGLRPRLFPALEGDKIYVCNFKLQYRAVFAEETRLPNEGEYKKYFEPLIENKTFRIRHHYGSYTKPAGTEVVRAKKTLPIAKE